MGCLNNFISPSELLNSGDLEECDIIEFNRLNYSHFGFYIGDGICVNVTGPVDNNNGMSSSSNRSCSKNFPKGMKMAQMLSSIAGTDRLKSKVRVNNCVLTATQLGLHERSKSDAIEKALEGLPKDKNGNVILEKGIHYDYHLMNNNCEFFATRCKYYGSGFSVQSVNPTMGTTLGTVERTTSAIRNELGNMVTDDDEDLAVRGAAAVAYAGYTAVGWTAYGIKTTTDAIAGGVLNVMSNLFD